MIARRRGRGEGSIVQRAEGPTDSTVPANTETHQQTGGA